LGDERGGRSPAEVPLFDQSDEIAKLLDGG